MLSDLHRLVLNLMAVATLLTFASGCQSIRPPAPSASQPTDAVPITLEETADIPSEPSPPPPPRDAADNMAADILAWDSVFKEYHARPGETNAPFVFNLTNVSPEQVMIFTTETTCDCTVAQLPATPWSLAPGGSGQIHATIDVSKKRGSVTNYVIVFTSKGNRLLSLKTVTPRPISPVSQTP